MKSIKKKLNNSFSLFGTKWFLVLISTIFIFFTVCNPIFSMSQGNMASDYPLEITDQLRRTVVIETQPKRIVSLATSNTEILFSLHAGSDIAGVDNSSKQDLKEIIPEIEKMSGVGEYANPNIEKIVALQADLVLAVPYQKMAVERLENLDIPVVVLEAESIEGVLDTINLIGKIIGREETTSTLISDLRQKLNSITEKTNNLNEDEKPTVLYLSEPLWVVGSSTLNDDLIQKGGGINIFSDLDGYQEVSLEAIIARDPQIIFCVEGYAPTLEYVMNETRLKDVTAVKNGRVYGINASLVDIPGPRIINALKLIAGYLHPELLDGKSR
jgi:iron complex transport system substrate-binding protein